MGVGREIFKLGYELSPIILTNGIASAVPGNMLPIITITQAANFTLGLLNGADPIDDNSFFAHFRALPGGNLFSVELGDYPFANQAVAANATIAKVLHISLLMESPANQPGAFISKLVTMTALKAALDLHSSLGGTYTVATPAYIYTNCILIDLMDVSDGSPTQTQSRWQWNFERPLLDQAQATTALGSLLSKLSGGLPSSSTVWSSLENSIGIAPGGAPALIQGGSNTLGTAVTGIVQSQGQ